MPDHMVPQSPEAERLEASGRHPPKRREAGPGEGGPGEGGLREDGMGEGGDHGHPIRPARSSTAFVDEDAAPLFDRTPLPLLVLDDRAVVVRANAAARHTFGLPCSSTALRHYTLSSLVDEHDIGRVGRFWTAVLERDADEAAEVLLRASNGDSFPARVFAFRQPHALSSVVLVVENLSELVSERDARKVVEASRAQSEARFSALFHGSPVGLVLTTTDGLIVAFNTEAGRLLGYTEPDAIAAGLGRLFPRHGSHQDAPNGLPLLDAGPTLVRGQHRDGRLVPLRAAVVSLTSMGETLHGLFLEDRRQEQQLEEQARQAQKLEAIGTLARGIAHDFNNLLMGVGGCVQMVLDSLDERHEARAMLLDVLGGVNNGAQIARQLLTFGRNSTTTPQVFDVAEILTVQASILNRLLGDSVQVALVNDAETTHVEMDPGLLDQILLNLAVNARDAMPEGGRVLFRTHNPPAMKGSGDLLAISVRDNGTGMTAAVRDRAFEPFYTTKVGTNGSGLGLSTVYGIVSQAGGSVRLQSVVGRGTEVEVLLPAVDAPPMSKPARRVLPAPKPGTGGVVLVVEDEPRVRLTTRYFLTRLGYRVLEACDLGEARECLTRFEGTIDVMLCDIALPDGRGPELLEAVADRDAGTAAIFMSAHHAGSGSAGGGRLPFPVLTKPFTESALREHLEEALLARARTSLGVIPIAPVPVEHNHGAATERPTAGVGQPKTKKTKGPSAY
jgi:PAS domain S-box-containing protein